MYVKNTKWGRLFESDPISLCNNPIDAPNEVV